MNKKMIILISTYFREQITAEPTKTTFDLAMPDITERALYSYITYLYTGRIPCQSPVKIDDPYGIVCQRRLVGFYALASKLEGSVAMDAAISAIISSVDKGNLPNCDTIRQVYAVTEPGCRLRKIVVDMHVCNAKALTDGYIKPFLLDVANASFQKLTELGKGDFDENLAAASCCDYHQHAEGAACVSKKRKRDDQDNEPEGEADGQDEG